MKVAVSTDQGQVSAHFGRCPEFTIAQIDNEQVVSKTTIENPGHHPGFLPEFLRKQDVTAIIAGGMGQRAQILFDDNGIEVFMGVSGNVDEVIAQFAKGQLKPGESLCKPGAGKGYGVEKTACDHPNEDKCEHDQGAKR